MRAHEFITESETEISDSPKHASTATYVIPDLSSQDSYKQYRFGVALAAARAHAENLVPANTESTYGENMIVVARSKEEEEQLKMALKVFGKSANLVTTPHSEETADTNTKSPSAPQYSRKLRKE